MTNSKDKQGYGSNKHVARLKRTVLRDFLPLFLFKKKCPREDNQVKDHARIKVCSRGYAIRHRQEWTVNDICTIVHRQAWISENKLGYARIS